MLHSVANGSHRFDITQVAMCLDAMTRKWAPPTRYTFRRNTTNNEKGL